MCRVCQIRKYKTKLHSTGIKIKDSQKQTTKYNQSGVKLQTYRVFTTKTAIDHFSELFDMLNFELIMSRYTDEIVPFLSSYLTYHTYRNSQVYMATVLAASILSCSSY